MTLAISLIFSGTIYIMKILQFQNCEFGMNCTRKGCNNRMTVNFKLGFQNIIIGRDENFNFGVFYVSKIGIAEFRGPN